MDEETEGKGLSLGDIFRTIFSQKWLALILAAVIFIGGTVGLYFYGKSKTDYSVTFVLQLPGDIKSPESYKYPDGTKFYYTDLISSEYLKSVKDSNEAYADIDTAGMLKSGAISIKRNLVEQSNSTTSNVIETNYTVTVSSKYFTSGDLAREFLIDLANAPCNYITNMKIDYDMYLSSAKEADRYDIELDSIERQVNYLQSSYRGFIDTYGESFIVDENKTLNSYSSELDVFIQNNTINIRRMEAITNKYIKAEDAKNKYGIEVEDLKRKLEVEEKTLNILKDLTTSEGTTAPVINSEVLNQARLVETLRQQVGIYEKYANEGVYSEDFAKIITEIENKVDEFTNEFAKVAASVYTKNTLVSFADSNIIKVESGMSLIMVVAISLVLAILISCIVAYVVGRVRLGKLNSKNTVTDAPVPEKQKEE